MKSGYKRKTKIRPVLIRKTVPECAQKYARYYVGTNEKGQAVFEFTQPNIVEAFMDEVGGLAKLSEGGKYTLLLEPEEQIVEDDYKAELLEYLLAKFVSYTSNGTILEEEWKASFWKEKFFEEKHRRK